MAQGGWRSWLLAARQACAGGRVAAAQLPSPARPNLTPAPARPPAPLLLPPRQLLYCRLYRDSTQYTNGKHVRDLSKLNRDMRQVLFITADPDAYGLQPENAIKVWELFCLFAALFQCVWEWVHDGVGSKQLSRQLC